MAEQKRKRLRLISLLLGVYSLMLGSSLVLMGIDELREGFGIVRLVMGLGMAGVGLYGIWDGVRDLLEKADGQAKVPAASQFILIDAEGKRSSIVNIGVLRTQLQNLPEKGNGQSFHLHIFPPFDMGEGGRLKQVYCLYQEHLILLAALEKNTGSYWLWWENMEPSMAEDWFGKFLSGKVELANWQPVEVYREEATHADGGEELWQQLLTKREGVLSFWHKLLVIFGESWHDEHLFFSDEDVSLAIEGVHTGQYQKVILEWGYYAFYIFPGRQNDLMVIWQIHSRQQNILRFLAREGTVVQVNFWLNRYMNEENLPSLDGWADVTEQITKGAKKHGKLF